MPTFPSNLQSLIIIITALLGTYVNLGTAFSKLGDPS